MDVATIVLLVLGAVPGFFVGRWSAESRRARSDMSKTWKGRSNYRR